MATPQYVYVMNRLSKAYAGGKQVLKDITLAFLPGAKIGVVGVNGSGKSTLLGIMAGEETEFVGEAWAAEGVSVGYLAQEPALDDTKDVAGNAMEGVAEKKAILDRYNEIAANYTEETSDEMTALQDQIDAQGLWDLDTQVEQALDALLVAARHFGFAAEPARAARGLLLEQVRSVRLAAQDLAGARGLEPLGGAAVRLHFPHRGFPVRIRL